MPVVAETSGRGGDCYRHSSCNSCLADLVKCLCDCCLVNHQKLRGKVGGSQHNQRDDNRTIGDKQLEQFWGLPPTREHLRDELDASCKQAVLLLSKLTRCELEALRIDAIVQRTITRVCMLLYGEETHMGDDLDKLVPRVAERAAGLGDLSIRVVALLSAWVVRLLVHRNPGHSQMLLDCVGRILAQSQEDKFQDRRTLREESGTDASFAGSLLSYKGTEGIVAFLRVCALMQAADWSKCLTVIHNNFIAIPGQLQGQTLYLKAYCLYYHGDYGYAIATVQALIESESVEGVMSQAYNLIGCCLRQMEKPHMALQQFRRALTLCPSVHPPILFNISIVYRDLEENDLELESLNLLLKGLSSSSATTEGEETEVDPNLFPDWPSVTLTQDCHSKMRRGTPLIQSISRIPVLYILAKRYLHFKRYEKAAESFLDLLCITESNSCMMDDCNVNDVLLPPLQTVYLEAATALLKAERLEAALAVCDKLLCKSRFLQQALSQDATTVGSEDDSDDGGFPFWERSVKSTSSRHSTLACATNIAGIRDIGNVCTVDKASSSMKQTGAHADNSAWKMRREESGWGRTDGGISCHGDGGASVSDHQSPSMRVTEVNRKRPREPSGEGDSSGEGMGPLRTIGRSIDNSMDVDSYQGDKVDADVNTVAGRKMGQDGKEEALFTAHAFIIQAQCLRKQGDGESAMEPLEHSLEILQTCCGDYEGDSEMMVDEERAGIKDDERNKAKRRRISSNSLHMTNSEEQAVPPKADGIPSPGSIAVLKSTAYHLRTIILMSHSQLQDAMKSALLSLLCCPSNIDALKTHAVLLEKQGRKSEAVKAWSRLKEAKSSDGAVYCL